MNVLIEYFESDIQSPWKHNLTCACDIYLSYFVWITKRLVQSTICKTFEARNVWFSQPYAKHSKLGTFVQSTICKTFQARNVWFSQPKIKMLIEVLLILLILPLYIGIFVIFWSIHSLIKIMTKASDILSDLMSNNRDAGAGIFGR